MVRSSSFQKGVFVKHLWVGLGVMAAAVLGWWSFSSQNKSFRSLPVPSAVEAPSISRPAVGDGKSEKPAVTVAETDLHSLALDVLNSSLNGDERTHKMFLLSQAGPAAMAELAGIARAPVSGALVDYEVSFRVRALEALDTMSGEHGGDVLKQFQWISSAETLHPTVALLVNIGIMGIQQGRPGKVSRFMDRVLKEGKKL
jgi:hypothetical protein